MDKKEQHKSPELKPVSERIIDLFFSDCASVMNRKEFENKFRLFLFLLTTKQRESTFLKLQRCLLYIEKSDKGLDESRIKSILKQKHKISKQYIEEACQPCKMFIQYRSKKNVK